MTDDNSRYSRASETANCDALIAAMPESARELVEVIGFLPTLDLMRKLGGKRVYIPRMHASGSAASQGLSIEVIKKLMAVRGGRHFEVPMGSSIERALRNIAI